MLKDGIGMTRKWGEGAEFYGFIAELGGAVPFRVPDVGAVRGW